MTTTDHANTTSRAAVAAPVDRLVRPSLSEALDAWWEAAYAEGRDGRAHDTEGGAAQKALQAIWAAHQAELVATAAAERERREELGMLLCELAECPALSAATDSMPAPLLQRWQDACDAHIARPNAKVTRGQRPQENDR